MKREHYGPAISLVILGVSLALWAQESHSRATEARDDPTWSAFRESIKQMHVAMNAVVPSVNGDTDVDFVNLMLPHHQAAIQMAKTQLIYGTDPEMRRLAQEIITDQQSEIELMQLWLKQHHTGKEQ